MAIEFVTQTVTMPESDAADELFGCAHDPYDLGWSLKTIRSVAESYVEEKGEDASLSKWVAAAEALWKRMGWTEDTETDALVRAY